MMEMIETPRLILRPFKKADYPLILRISSDPGTVKYLYFWGRNGMTPEQDATRFMNHALKEWEKDPVVMREYCVILKETGEMIGDASVEIVDDDTAEIGWILLPEHRGRGYATEAGRAMMDFGFLRYGKDRVIAHCDTRNDASQGVMRRLGMALAHVEKEGRAPKFEGGPRGDEATYALSRVDWAWQKYRLLTCENDQFLPLPDLTDGEVRLVCEEKAPADPVKKWVPAYSFGILVNGVRAGNLDLRLGTVDGLFYGGQIGYNVDEAYRGKGYAGRACRLARRVLRLHGMNAALITNDVNNLASRRVCEKLGCPWLCRATLPEDNDMRKEGMEEVNLFLLPAQEGPSVFFPLFR